MLGLKSLQHSDEHSVSEVIPSIMAQSWPWGSQIVVLNNVKLGVFEQRNDEAVTIKKP